MIILIQLRLALAVSHTYRIIIFEMTLLFDQNFIFIPFCSQLKSICEAQAIFTLIYPWRRILINILSIICKRTRISIVCVVDIPEKLSSWQGTKLLRTDWIHLKRSLRMCALNMWVESTWISSTVNRTWQLMVLYLVNITALI